MIPLTIKEEINHNKQKICYICKKEFDTNDEKHYDVKFKVESIIVIIQENIELQPIIYVM